MEHIDKAKTQGGVMKEIDILKSEYEINTSFKYIVADWILKGLNKYYDLGVISKSSLLNHLNKEEWISFRFSGEVKSEVEILKIIKKWAKLGDRGSTIKFTDYFNPHKLLCLQKMIGEKNFFSLDWERFNLPRKLQNKILNHPKAFDSIKELTGCKLEISSKWLRKLTRHIKNLKRLCFYKCQYTSPSYKIDKEIEGSIEMVQVVSKEWDKMQSNAKGLAQIFRAVLKSNLKNSIKEIYLPNVVDHKRTKDYLEEIAVGKIPKHMTFEINQTSSGYFVCKITNPTGKIKD